MSAFELCLQIEVAALHKGAVPGDQLEERGRGGARGGSHHRRVHRQGLTLVHDMAPLEHLQATYMG